MLGLLTMAGYCQKFMSFYIVLEGIDAIKWKYTLKDKILTILIMFRRLKFYRKYYTIP